MKIPSILSRTTSASSRLSKSAKAHWFCMRISSTGAYSSMRLINSSRDTSLAGPRPTNNVCMKFFCSSKILKELSIFPNHETLRPTFLLKNKCLSMFATFFQSSFFFSFYQFFLLAVNFSFSSFTGMIFKLPIKSLLHFASQPPSSLWVFVLFIFHIVWIIFLCTT